MAVLPWRGAKLLGYVEYLAHGEGTYTTILVVLEILRKRLADLGLTLDHTTIDITLRDASGRVVHQSTTRYPGVAAFARLTSNDFLPASDVVHGSMEYLVHCWDAEGRSLNEALLRANISADAFLLWTDERRTCTCTHANMATGVASSLQGAWREVAWQAREWTHGNHTYAGAISVFEDDQYTSAIILQSYRLPWRRVSLELRNAEGEALCATVPGLAPHETRELWIHDAFPAAREFLQGGPGNLVLTSCPPDLRRYRFLVKTRNRQSGAFSLDHSHYVSRNARFIYSAGDHARLGKGFMYPHSVILNGTMRTSVILFNTELEDTEKTVGLLLYDRAGGELVHVRRAATLPPHGFVRLDFRNYLQLAPGEVFDGHFEAYYAAPSSADGRYSTGLHGQVLYDGPRARESTQVGAAVPWHSPRGFVRPEWILNYRTLFMVVPYFCTDALETFIHFANVSHAWDYAETAGFLCELVDRDGCVVERREITLGPNEHIYESFRVLFNHQPADGIGLVFVRAQDPALSWLPLHFFIECRAAGVTTSDHGQGLYHYDLIGR